jgi:hypothetical protein
LPLPEGAVSQWDASREGDGTRGRRAALEQAWRGLTAPGVSRFLDRPTVLLAWLAAALGSRRLQDTAQVAGFLGHVFATCAGLVTIV